MLSAEEDAITRTFSSTGAKPSSGDHAGKQLGNKHPDLLPNTHLLSSTSRNLSIRNKYKVPKGFMYKGVHSIIICGYLLYLQIRMNISAQKGRNG